MRERDDAALELQLRRVLIENLGSLPLGITADDLERRRQVRRRTRRRQRGWIALGLAAAITLPVGVLVVGQRPSLLGIADPSGRPTPNGLATVGPSDPSSTPLHATPVPEPSSATPAPVLGDRPDLFVETRTPSKTVCDNLDRYDTETGARRRVVTCANRIAVTPDGSRAAVGGDHRLAVVDLDDGHQIASMKTDGFAFPITWSTSGRWLQWGVCDSNPTVLTQADMDHPCTFAIGSPDNARQNRIPGPSDRSYIGVSWLPDESHVLVPTRQGTFIGNGDGTNLKPLAEDDPLTRVLGQGISPDLTKRAYVQPTKVDGRTTVVDLGAAALDGSGARNLTNFEPSARIRGFAWSPDGQTLVVIKGQQGPDERSPAGPNELWFVGLDGSMRRLDVPVEIRGPDDAGTFTFLSSPGASRFAIEVGRGAAVGGAPTAIDTIIVSTDGSTPVVLRDARRPAWSRDGRAIAFVTTTGVYGPREGATIPPATIEVANADGSDRHLVVAVPNADLDYFTFRWAAP